jgi:hypothetical protein
VAVGYYLWKRAVADQEYRKEKQKYDEYMAKKQQEQHQ